MSGINNKFKTGDIITNFNDKPSYNFTPAKDWIRNIDTNHATWKVTSVEPNGDYKLQRLYTLTKSPLLEKDSPIYQKDKTMSKKIIDFWNYKLWNADDVKAVYNRALDDVKKEKENSDRLVKEYNEEMATKWGPLIKEYFKKKHSIEKTADKYGVEKEEVWDVLDENELKTAVDYLDVKEELFGEDNENFEKFVTASDYILKDNKKSTAAARSVLGNPDLNMTIGEYFRKSTKGGKKSTKKVTKGRKKSTKRGTKGAKRRDKNI